MLPLACTFVLSSARGVKSNPMVMQIKSFKLIEEQLAAVP